jgi:hypothetical protein
MCDRSLSLLGTGISIKSDRVKLVVCAPASSLRLMMQSCRIVLILFLFKIFCIICIEIAHKVNFSERYKSATNQIAIKVYLSLPPPFFSPFVLIKK